MGKRVLRVCAWVEPCAGISPRRDSLSLQMASTRIPGGLKFVHAKEEANTCQNTESFHGDKDFCSLSLSPSVFLSSHKQTR